MSLNISDVDMPKEWHNRVNLSPSTSGNIVETLNVALPIEGGSPVDRDINKWASESVESMLVRVRQGLASEYMRRVRELVVLPKRIA